MTEIIKKETNIALSVAIEEEYESRKEQNKARRSGMNSSVYYVLDAVSDVFGKYSLKNFGWTESSHYGRAHNRIHAHGIKESNLQENES